MQFREHPGVMGKRDAYPFDPRLLRIEENYNVRDLKAADEQEALAELKESIRANGVRVPLEVRLQGEDVIVVAGHRRHVAVMELIGEGEDIKSVPVIPEPKGTNEADRILNLVVSNSGKPLKPLEVAEVVRRLIAFGWDKPQIAKRMGWKSPGSVSLYLDMMAMPEPVKQQVRDNDVSATFAAKLVKEEPEKAAELIRLNKEENARIKGAGKRHKVTEKTMQRDRPKAVTRFSEVPKQEPDPKPQEFVAEVEISDEQRAAIETAAAATLARERGQTFSESNPTPAADLPAALAGTQETEPHPQLQTAAEREQPRSMSVVLKEVEEVTAPVLWPRPCSQVEKLLLGFMIADVTLLATDYRKLCAEREHAAGEGNATEAQEQLCVAADVIGALRFPDEWEQAKANSELAQVA